MIYDCFPFFNELDVIEIRFKELYDHVDYFVLCESNLTHSGNPKPLYFQENKDRYAPFSNKIIHLVCDDPVKSEPGQNMDWTRERHQRNFIYTALSKRCNGEDIIIISDADEIFAAREMKQLQAINARLYSLEMRSSWYYLNCVCEPRWTAGKAARFKTIRGAFNGNLSNVRASGTEGYILDCGWHISYMGGRNKVKQKLQSFAHQEFNVPKMTNDHHVQLAIRFGSAIWDEFKEIAPRGNVPYWNYVVLPESNLPDCVKRGDYNHLVSEANFTKLDYDCGNLYHLFNLAKNLTGEGAVVDIGCAEGRTSIYLANALPDDQIYCVDLNVSVQFYKNMNALTDGNFVAVQEDALSFLSEFSQPIKILHVDTGSAELTAQIIDAAKSKLAAQHILCGYDRSKTFPNLENIEVSGDFWFKIV